MQRIMSDISQLIVFVKEERDDSRNLTDFIFHAPRFFENPDICVLMINKTCHMTSEVGFNGKEITSSDVDVKIDVSADHRDHRGLKIFIRDARPVHPRTHNEYSDRCNLCPTSGGNHHARLTKVNDLFKYACRECSGYLEKNSPFLI